MLEIAVSEEEASLFPEGTKWYVLLPYVFDRFRETATDHEYHSYRERNLPVCRFDFHLNPCDLKLTIPPHSLTASHVHSSRKGRRVERTLSLEFRVFEICKLSLSFSVSGSRVRGCSTRPTKSLSHTLVVHGDRPRVSELA